MNSSSVQAATDRLNLLLIDAHRGSHRRQGLDVEVDRAGTQRATARVCHARLAQTVQQATQQQGRQPVVAAMVRGNGALQH